MTHTNEPNPELLKELEQLKQSVTGLQSLLDASNHERTRLGYELVQAKQNMDVNERLQSACLTSFGHEIRTPINCILGFSELLKDPDITIEERQQYIEVINNRCQALGKIIAELDFLRNSQYQDFIP